MLIVATRGNGIFLLAESLEPRAPARILDVGTGQYFRPVLLGAALARGYWTAVDPPEPADSILKMVTRDYVLT